MNMVTIGTPRAVESTRVVATDQEWQPVLTALELMRSAIADLQAGRVEAAERVLDRLGTLEPDSSWVPSATRWLQDRVPRRSPADRCAARRSTMTSRATETTTSSVAADFALSEREEEVLTLLSRGFSSRQIAQTLFVSQSTVAYHLGRMYAKTNVTSRHQLVALLWVDERRSA